MEAIIEKIAVPRLFPAKDGENPDEFVCSRRDVDSKRGLLLFSAEEGSGTLNNIHVFTVTFVSQQVVVIIP